MTIEKGRPWGEPWTGAAPTVEVADDAALAEAAHQGLLEGDRRPATGPGTDRATGSPEAARPFTPMSGDLLRTIGLDAPRPPGQRHRYPVDLVVAHLGKGGDQPVVAPFVAHLTVRNRPFTGLGPGLAVAVMTAAWLGDLRLGPRAHPNDGRVDVTEGTVGMLQRREASRRAAAGAHLPHPGLRVTRCERWERTWPRPVPIWLDGVRRGRFDRVVVEVVADAVVVVA